jgi:hypothetical protein
MLKCRDAAPIVGKVVPSTTIGLMKANVLSAHEKLFAQFDKLQVLPLYTYFDEDTVACRFNVYENGAAAYEMAVFITVDEQGLFKEIRTFKNSNKE